MDPIKSNRPPNAPRSTPPRQTHGTKSQKSFGVNQTPPGGQPLESDRDQVIHPNFARIRSRIEHALNRSLDKDQVFQDLIQSEVEHALGSGASKQLVDSVTEAYRKDPALTKLFDQLYEKATADSNKPS